ncbi:MAG: ABC transporter substrate-binding protein [Burkholderiaceae bacterium]
MGDSGTGPAGAKGKVVGGRGGAPQGARRRLCLAGAAATLGLAACGRPPAPDAPPAPLRLAMDLWPGYYPAVLADELGYLSEARVQVQFSFPANTDSMIAEFAAGHVDIIAVAMGDLINATHGRAAVQVFMVTDESAGGDAVLARPGVDLKGKGRLLLATNLGGFGELLMREFVQRQGVDPHRVAWINADAADVPRLLAAGDVDIGHTWEPYATEAEAAGAVRLFSSADTPGLIPDVLAASRATVERRQAELRRFSAAWLRAADWWLDHLDEGAQRVARRLQSDAAKISLKGVRLMRLDDNRHLLGTGGQAPALAAVVRRYSAFFLDRGTLARPVEPADLLRGDLLP